MCGMVFEQHSVEEFPLWFAWLYVKSISSYYKYRTGFQGVLDLETRTTHIFILHYRYRKKSKIRTILMEITQ